MNTSWIKRHEKLPAMDDLPIITTCYEGGKWRTQLWTEYTPRAEHEYTYWTRFRAEPPPRELTQREMDNDAAKLACERAFVSCRANWVGAEEAVRQVIYAERREVAKIMALYHSSENWGDNRYSKEMRQLRARLDEQGGRK